MLYFSNGSSEWFYWPSRAPLKRRNTFVWFWWKLNHPWPTSSKSKRQYFGIKCKVIDCFQELLFLLIGCIATYPSSWPKSPVTRPFVLGVARTGEWALSTLGRNIDTTTVSKRNLLSGDKWILCNFYKIRVIHDHFIYLTWDFLFDLRKRTLYISLHACKYLLYSQDRCDVVISI